MVAPFTVTKKAPAKVLSSFVAEYVFRTTVVPESSVITKAMPLRLVSSIDFFLGDAYDTVDCKSGQHLPFVRCTIRGPRTYKKNLIKITGGNFTSFSIRLQPEGLYSLLGIPVLHFRDEALDAALLGAQPFPEITERLMDCSNIAQCIAIVEPYLLQMAKHTVHNIHVSEAVQQMASLLITSKIPPSISHLQANLFSSPRQLERNFVKQIGTTPKLYSRMVRFSNTLHYKMLYTQTSWASLAYEFGYTDQMHLIKDFQHFLGITPGNFCPDDFAF